MIGTLREPSSGWCTPPDADPPRPTIAPAAPRTGATAQRARPAASLLMPLIMRPPSAVNCTATSVAPLPHDPTRRVQVTPLVPARAVGMTLASMGRLKPGGSAAPELP